MKAGCLLFILVLPVLIIILPIIWFVMLFNKTDQLSQELKGLYIKVGYLEKKIEKLISPESKIAEEQIFEEQKPEEVLLEPEIIEEQPEFIQQIEEPVIQEELPVQKEPQEQRISLNLDKYTKDDYSLTKAIKDYFTEFDFETFFAGRVLNRIGAIAIIFGVGFFLKYAFDNNWINEYLQVFIAFMIGGGFLYGGHKYHNGRYKPFAQGLTGTGIAVLYSTIYAAYNFYQLIPNSFAFILMSLVTILTFFQSLKYDSIAVAILGLIGGFLTPFLLSTDSGNTTGLLAYLVFLNALIVVLMHKKDSWKILELFGLLATYFIFAGINPSVISGTIFLTIYWVLYLGLDITSLIRGANTYPVFKHVISGLNAGFYLLLVCKILSLQHENLAALAALITGGVYLSTLLIRKNFAQPENQYKQYVITSIIALVVAINTILEGFPQVIALSIAAISIFWLGVEYKAGYVWKTALAVLSLAFTNLLITKGAISYEPIADFTPVINIRALAFMFLIGSIAACSYFLSKTEDKESSFQTILRYTWTSMLFILFTVEINDYFLKNSVLMSYEEKQMLYFNKGLSFIMVWMTYALSLTRFGLKKSIKPFQVIGFGILGTTVLKLLATGMKFIPIASFIPVINFRFVAFGFVIAGIIIICRWIKQKQSFLHYVWAILLFILLTCEVRDFFAREVAELTYGSKQLLSFNKALSYISVWLIYSIALIRVGLIKYLKPLQILGFGAMALIILKLFISGYNYFPITEFVPVLNARFAVFAAVIAGIIFTSQWLDKRNNEQDWENGMKEVMNYTWCILLFSLISIETSDFFARKIYYLAGNTARNVEFTKNMILLLSWSLYSLPLIRFGLQKKIGAMLWCGAGSMVIALFTGIIWGYKFYPIDSFIPLFNFRFLALGIITAGLFLVTKWIKDSIDDKSRVKTILSVIQIILCTFMFFIITFEVKDYYNRELLAISGYSPQLDMIKNMKQLGMSLAWLIYSIVIMTWGILRRLKVVRYASIIVISMSILKIFLLDLAFLDQPYRIISFIGLGLILFLASYLYHRFASLITNKDKEELKSKVL